MNIRHFLSGRRSRRGFSLVELLAVMGIMGILLAVTVPSIEGMNMSAGISQGGQLFTDQVGLARQLASARNITVQVRCVKIPARSANGYTGIQLWSAATATPISRLITMPDGIAISQDTANISKLFSTFNAPGVMPAGSPASGDSYVGFSISPGGMVGPLPTTGTEPNMTGAAVGVVAVSHAADTTLPSNFVIVQLNPLTAATTAYRP